MPAVLLLCLVLLFAVSFANPLLQQQGGGAQTTEGFPNDFLSLSCTAVAPGTCGPFVADENLPPCDNPQVLLTCFILNWTMTSSVSQITLQRDAQCVQMLRKVPSHLRYMGKWCPIDWTATGPVYMFGSVSSMMLALKPGKELLELVSTMHRSPSHNNFTVRYAKPSIKAFIDVRTQNRAPLRCASGHFSLLFAATAAAGSVYTHKLVTATYGPHTVHVSMVGTGEKGPGISIGNSSLSTPVPVPAKIPLMFRLTFNMRTGQCILFASPMLLGGVNTQVASTELVLAVGYGISTAPGDAQVVVEHHRNDMSLELKPGISAYVFDGRVSFEGMLDDLLQTLSAGDTSSKSADYIHLARKVAMNPGSSGELQHLPNTDWNRCMAVCNNDKACRFLVKDQSACTTMGWIPSMQHGGSMDVYMKKDPGESAVLLTAQILKVEHSGDYLQVSEIEVYDDKGRNVAVTAQISTSSGYAGHSDPQSLVDRRTPSDGTTSPFWHSVDTGPSFIQLTLTADTPIHSIVLHNRGDCCKERLKNARVRLLTSLGGSVWEEDITETRHLYIFHPRARPGEGGRREGLKYFVYDGYFWDDINYKAKAALLHHNPTATVTSFDGYKSFTLPRTVNFTLLLEGGFIPRASGEHAFRLGSDDAAYLWLHDATTRSPLVAKLPPPPPQPLPQVEFYEHCDFQGRKWTFGPGRYSYSQIAADNDNYSSVKIPKGLRVQVWEHDFAGDTTVFDSDVACLVHRRRGNGWGNWNDVISSFEITGQAVVQPPMQPTPTPTSSSALIEIPGLHAHIYKEASVDLVAGKQYGITILHGNNYGHGSLTFEFKEPGSLKFTSDFKGVLFSSLVTPEWDACDQTTTCAKGTFCRIGDRRCLSDSSCENANRLDKTKRDCTRM